MKKTGKTKTFSFIFKRVVLVIDGIVRAKTFNTNHVAHPKLEKKKKLIFIVLGEKDPL